MNSREQAPTTTKLNNLVVSINTLSTKIKSLPESAASEEISDTTRGDFLKACWEAIDEAMTSNSRLIGDSSKPLDLIYILLTKISSIQDLYYIQKRFHIQHEIKHETNRNFTPDINEKLETGTDALSQAYKHYLGTNGVCNMAAVKYYLERGISQFQDESCQYLFNYLGFANPELTVDDIYLYDLKQLRNKQIADNINTEELLAEIVKQANLGNSEAQCQFVYYVNNLQEKNDPRHKDLVEKRALFIKRGKLRGNVWAYYESAKLALQTEEIKNIWRSEVRPYLQGKKKAPYLVKDIEKLYAIIADLQVGVSHGHIDSFNCLTKTLLMFFMGHALHQKLNYGKYQKGIVEDSDFLVTRFWSYMKPWKITATYNNIAAIAQGSIGCQPDGEIAEWLANQATSKDLYTRLNRALLNRRPHEQLFKELCLLIDIDFEPAKQFFIILQAIANTPIQAIRFPLLACTDAAAFMTVEDLGVNNIALLNFPIKLTDRQDFNYFRRQVIDMDAQIKERAKQRAIASKLAAQKTALVIKIVEFTKSNSNEKELGVAQFELALLMMKESEGQLLLCKHFYKAFTTLGSAKFNNLCVRHFKANRHKNAKGTSSSSYADLNDEDKMLRAFDFLFGIHNKQDIDEARYLLDQVKENLVKLNAPFPEMLTRLEEAINQMTPIPKPVGNGEQSSKQQNKVVAKTDVEPVKLDQIAYQRFERLKTDYQRLHADIEALNGEIGTALANLEQKRVLCHSEVEELEEAHKTLAKMTVVNVTLLGEQDENNMDSLAQELHTKLSEVNQLKSSFAAVNKAINAAYSEWLEKQREEKKRLEASSLPASTLSLATSSSSAKIMSATSITADMASARKEAKSDRKKFVPKQKLEPNDILHFLPIKEPDAPSAFDNHLVVEKKTKPHQKSRNKQHGNLKITAETAPLVPLRDEIEKLKAEWSDFLAYRKQVITEEKDEFDIGCAVRLLDIKGCMLVIFRQIEALSKNDRINIFANRFLTNEIATVLLSETSGFLMPIKGSPIEKMIEFLTGTLHSVLMDQFHGKKKEPLSHEDIVVLIESMTYMRDNQRALHADVERLQEQHSMLLTVMTNIDRAKATNLSLMCLSSIGHLLNAMNTSQDDDERHSVAYSDHVLLMYPNANEPDFQLFKHLLDLAKKQPNALQVFIEAMPGQDVGLLLASVQQVMARESKWLATMTPQVKYLVELVVVKINDIHELEHECSP